MKVILGSFTFPLGPEKQIDFTGPRTIAKIDIPGAPPAYQDMGEDEHTYAWSGVLEGTDAEKDCKALLKLKENGAMIRLIAGMIDKKVRIREFNYSYLRNDYIRYSITLIEIQNEARDLSSNKKSNETAKAKTKKIIKAEPNYYTHIMKHGDTLWNLAVSYYKNGNLWTKIAKASSISNPRRISVGCVIKIPKG